MSACEYALRASVDFHGHEDALPSRKEGNHHDLRASATELKSKRRHHGQWRLEHANMSFYSNCGRMALFAAVITAPQAPQFYVKQATYDSQKIMLLSVRDVTVLCGRGLLHQSVDLGEQA